jgi:hypothetical protein
MHASPAVLHTPQIYYRMRPSKRNSKPLSTTKSVTGMKDLLTLQLHPSRADVDNLLPLNRSTFGFDKPQNSKKRFSETRHSRRQHGQYTRLPLPIRTQNATLPIRDTPIYLEPGSPLLSDFPFSPPSSSEDTVDECSSPNTEIDERDETMVNTFLFRQVQKLI